MKPVPDHHRTAATLKRQAIAYEPWLAVGIGLATGAVLFAASFAFAKLLGMSQTYPAHQTPHRRPAAAGRHRARRRDFRDIGCQTTQGGPK
jgi:hypothetical protein